MRRNTQYLTHSTGGLSTGYGIIAAHSIYSLTEISTSLLIDLPSILFKERAVAVGEKTG